jgi:hypothetical protein
MSNCHIDTAIRSSKPDECYLIRNEYCFVFNYVKKEFLSGPIPITKVFPMLCHSKFEGGIGCAFHGGKNHVFIFRGKQFAEIQYTPVNDQHSTTKGKIFHNCSITERFPKLKGTWFENDIDAAIRYTEKDVYLFKKNKCIRLDYLSGVPGGEHRIHETFPFLVGTVFETGIDAAFASNDKGEGYIFKGKHYVRINVAEREGKALTDFIVSRKIRFIKDIWN